MDELFISHSFTSMCYLGSADVVTALADAYGLVFRICQSVQMCSLYAYAGCYLCQPTDMMQGVLGCAAFLVMS